MYAIFEKDSHQYKVTEGDVIDVGNVTEKEGETIVFSHVLLVGNDSDIQVGQPYLPSVQVKGIVLLRRKSPKIHILRFQAKSRSRTKKGYREDRASIKIQKIETIGEKKTPLSQKSSVKKPPKVAKKKKE
ncbi:MAG TPA: 50S ribosomal protein L21 [Patescibacteria group bacterium]|nr:50S ribosomal protein L21 [Patescibacteria group bacterium]